MRNIYQEIIEEGNEILENGMGHLRRRTRTHAPTAPIKEKKVILDSIDESDSDFISQSELLKHGF